eukprot:8886849-Pyramimonas_sp.AAC.1
MFSFGLELLAACGAAGVSRAHFPALRKTIQGQVSAEEIRRLMGEGGYMRHSCNRGRRRHVRLRGRR